MEILTTDMILKLIGAAVAFAVGIWLGLGLPGLKDRDEPRRGSPSRYLHGTWLNRLFFGMPRPPRRFDGGRLVVPKKRGAVSGEEGEAEGDGDDRPPVVRLRGRA